MQAIQQPELASMANLKAQISETLNNSRLSDAEKLEILHRAQDRYDKIQESVGPKSLKTEIAQPRLLKLLLLAYSYPLIMVPSLASLRKLSQPCLASLRKVQRMK